MQGVVLAAGYGTRLGALGRDTPKALLNIGGRPVIDHLLESLAGIGVSRVLAVTNARFHGAFEAWVAGEGHPMPVELVCDGSTEPANRLGAVRDLDLALRRIGGGRDVFVSASDNLYAADLSVLTRRFAVVKEPVVALIEEKDARKLSRSGVAVPGPDGRLAAFVEKPAVPPSCYAAPPLYVYPAGIEDDIEAFLADPERDHDAPGNLVAFLVPRRAVWGVVLEGSRLDIGSLTSYEEAQRRYGGAGAGDPAADGSD